MEWILVTGGAGNIASHLAQRLLDTQLFKVVVIDNLVTGSVKKIPVSEQCVFVKADVNNYNEIIPIFLKYDFKYVFHFAALVGVKRTLENPLGVFKDINGIKNILDLSKSCGIKRVFYSSSSEVYGEPVSIPQNENLTPLNSKLPYAIVKNLGESMCKAYEQEYGLSYTIFRFFNTYGPNQNHDFVIPRFIKMAVQNEPITIYGDGLQTRTFCFVDDTVNTCVKILTAGLLINDTINIGSDIEYTMIDLANIIIEETGSASVIHHLPALAEGDMKRRCPDISKMKAIIDREPMTLREGIRRLLVPYKTA